MAHPETEAVAPSPNRSVADAAADFEKYLFDGEEAEEEQDDELPVSEEAEGDEPEADDLEEEQDDAGGEPETAIEAPVSLNAEEKAAFAAASPEAQRAWAAAETRRNAQVQEATTKASSAQREAESRAAAADAEARKVYAVQLGEIAKALEPAAPDPRLAQHDPAAYTAAEAHYRAAKAQHDDFVQQVNAVQLQADTDAQKAFVEARDRELMQIPEIANTETRKGYLDKAFGVAAELGYDTNELAQGMTARDVKALALVASLKDKADKYDAAMSRKMQRVRSGKVRTNTPGSPHANTARANSAQSWDRVKGARSKEAQASAFADFLGL